MIDNQNREILLNFGNKLRYYRRAKGYSQEKLASIANIHRTYIGMLERAEKNPTLLMMIKLANALEMEVKNLF